MTVRTLRAACPALLGLIVALGGCRDDPPRGTAAPPAAGDPGQAEIVPADPAPLGPELEALAQLIGVGRTGPARIRIRKHLVLHPGDAPATFLFGLTYHKELKYDEARQWYAKALALDPAYSPIYHFDGWAAYYLGAMEDARRSFRTHLAYQPHEADSHFGLGVVAIEEGRLDEAVTHLRESIELLAGQAGAEKGISKAHARLGDIRVQEGDLEAARAEYEESVRLYPDHYEVHHKLAQVYDRLDMPAEAEAARARHVEVRARVRPELGDDPDPKSADSTP